MAFRKIAVIALTLLTMSTAHAYPSVAWLADARDLAKKTKDSNPGAKNNSSPNQGSSTRDSGTISFSNEEKAQVPVGVAWMEHKRQMRENKERIKRDSENAKVVTAGSESGCSALPSHGIRTFIKRVSDAATRAYGKFPDRSNTSLSRAVNISRNASQTPTCVGLNSITASNKDDKAFTPSNESAQTATVSSHPDSGSTR
jgi:hypothetical protein